MDALHNAAWKQKSIDVFQVIQNRSYERTFLVCMIYQNVIVKDISTSIRLITDECNI